ncbi:MAG: mannitol dehydrogenase family protein [Spirochaetaceae bacterium]|nr:mannitol dehydrogenase family protein [Spirochaetaceae bacterium]
MEISRKSIAENAAAFAAAGVHLPAFDIEAVAKRTAEAPVWVHIGLGNLFKAFHAVLQQKLLEAGLSDNGIIAVVPNDFESIGRLYTPHDNLFLQVIMKSDGALLKNVVASVTEILAANPAAPSAWARLKTVFAAPSLQMVTLTITEKGYNIYALDGSVRPEIAAEFEAGIGAPSHTMLKLCALLHERFLRGSHPVALLTTDNFAHNGAKLRAAITGAAKEYLARGKVEAAFLDYLNDEAKVSFPLSMIDKITPFPAETVARELASLGLGGMEVSRTERGSVNAAFVNAEEAEYLVVEDRFPNGRPPLEKAGVLFTNAETVDKTERMKVGTCLNPLHTALAIFGCLLGYTKISDEMKDAELSALVRRMAEKEGLPVVSDPLIISPQKFVKEVIEVRLPNPNIPDTPQRIATDTSQKLAIRFGETIKIYKSSASLDAGSLTLIPLTLAAWCRYLLGVDDSGAAFKPSPDPLLAEMTALLDGVELGKPESARGKLKKILSNEKIFGVDLYDAGLGEKIEGYFAGLIAGPGAVRASLKKYL